MSAETVSSWVCAVASVALIWLWLPPWLASRAADRAVLGVLAIKPGSTVHIGLMLAGRMQAAEINDALDRLVCRELVGVRWSVKGGMVFHLTAKGRRKMGLARI